MNSGRWGRISQRCGEQIRRGAGMGARIGCGMVERRRERETQHRWCARGAGSTRPVRARRWRRTRVQQPARGFRCAAHVACERRRVPAGRAGRSVPCVTRSGTARPRAPAKAVYRSRAAPRPRVGTVRCRATPRRRAPCASRTRREMRRRADTRVVPAGKGATTSARARTDRSRSRDDAREPRPKRRSSGRPRSASPVT